MTGRPRYPIAPACVLALAAMAAPLGVAGQAPDEAPHEPAPASAFVDPGHWSLDVIGRLDALGLTPPDFDHGRTPLSRQRIRSVLEHARAAGSAGSAEVPAGWYLDRFEEEVGTAWMAPDRQFLRTDPIEFRTGYEQVTGRLLPGIRETDAGGWIPPRPVADRHDPLLEARLSAHAGDHLTLVASPQWSGEARWGELYATAVWAPVGVWLGRRPLGYGAGRSGRIVLHGTTPMDGAGLYLTRGIPLGGDHPVFLRFEAFLARGGDNGVIGDPWLSGGRLLVTPHPRLRLGVSRGAQVGGEGNTSITPRDLFFVLIGKHAGEGSELDNQIAAVDLWFRPALGSLPLVTYLEWGFEDSAGAWWDVPGIVGGMRLAALPRLPQVSLGFEYAAFAEHCCGNPPWYRHKWFREGWVDRGRLLGHPLGGHGREAALLLSGDFERRGVLADGRLFLRTRGDDNLFAPDRLGGSIGAEGELTVIVARYLRGMARVVMERGSEGDWLESRLFVGFRAVVDGPRF